MYDAVFIVEIRANNIKTTLMASNSISFILKKGPNWHCFRVIYVSVVLIEMCAFKDCKVAPKPAPYHNKHSRIKDTWKHCTT